MGSTIKYTCRFDVQIENDKDFQVARRLIGAKGINMKRIIEMCSRNVSRSTDVVKLRLRGKGSGFREGPTKEESNDPLHLCISSRFFDKYKIACDSVQELILQVYEEYKKYCEKHKRDITYGLVSTEYTNGGYLSIKKHESITGRRSQVQPMPSSFNPCGAPLLEN